MGAEGAVYGSVTCCGSGRPWPLRGGAPDPVQRVRQKRSAATKAKKCRFRWTTRQWESARKLSDEYIFVHFDIFSRHLSVVSKKNVQKDPWVPYRSEHRGQI